MKYLKKFEDIEISQIEKAYSEYIKALRALEPVAIEEIMKDPLSYGLEYYPEDTKKPELSASRFRVDGDDVTVVLEQEISKYEDNKYYNVYLKKKDINIYFKTKQFDL